MVGLPGIHLTEEQLEIVNSCPPKVANQRGSLVRVTAAAGAGKTTTLLALALKAAELGHTDITYVTFTRAAAKDGKERLEKAMRNGPQSARRVSIEARTLHAFAMRAPMDQTIEELSDDDDDDEPPTAPQSQRFAVRSEGAHKKWIFQQCEQAVESFLRPCYRELQNSSKGAESLSSKKKAAKDKAMFFILKSLQNFCRSDWTLKQYRTKRDKNGRDIYNRDYHPIKLFLQDKEKTGRLGFDPAYYGSDAQISFYADQACKLWKAAKRQRWLTYDIAMKHAQLSQQELPGTILLVDESQDMDACQTDWIARQQVKTYNKVVFMVGDCCQAIYGFRGAKSENLMKLECDQDKTLTESFRFGQNISHLANLVLYAKEKSPQTKVDRNGLYTKWIPYRTSPGIKDKESTVTTQPLLPHWKSHKVTVIACKNATLLLEALAAMGFSFPDKEKDDDDDDDEGQEENGEDAVDAVPVVDFEDIDPSQLPLIHINGRGESSGMGLWKKTLKIIGAVYDLFALYQSSPEATTTLDPTLFEDFAGTPLNWKHFTERVEDEELSKYITPISVVRKFRTNTTKAMELFEGHVMKQNISAEKAHIILTTCHSAKGMEWDNVHVCDDFSFDLCSFKKVSGKARAYGGTKRQKIAELFEFGFKEFGDDINLAYVACTRAKKMVYVPSIYTSVLESMDELHDWILSLPSLPPYSIQNISLNGCEDILWKEDATQLYNGLVRPLRNEWALKEEDKLSTFFIEHGENGEDDENGSLDGEQKMKPAVVTQDTPPKKGG